MESKITLRGHHLNSLQDYVFIVHAYDRTTAKEVILLDRIENGYGKIFAKHAISNYDRIYTAACVGDPLQVRLVDTPDNICGHCKKRNGECEKPWEKDREVAMRYGLSIRETPFTASEIIDAVLFVKKKTHSAEPAHK